MNKKQFTLGILVIAVGVAVLLANAGIGTFRDIVAAWWPVLLILLGAFMWWGNPRYFVWPLVVVSIGVILLGNSLGLTTIGFGDIILPLLIVGGGLSILANAVPRIRQDTATADSNDVSDLSAVMSGISARVVSSDYKGGSASAILGGIELDLRDVTIKKEAILTLTAIMGGVELRVPENVVVKSRAVTILGGTENKTKPTTQATAPVLYLDGTIVMGGVEVKR